MPTRAGRAALLTLVVTAGQVAVPAHAAGNSGNVLSIGDGDTLRLRSTAGVITVRLACIDAPESSQGPWGAAAGRELQALLPRDKAVELKAKATDRYGRNVAEVFSGGRNINQALVASGAAFVYWQYIAGCDRNTYSRLETEARQRRLGVWSTPGGSPNRYAAARPTLGPWQVNLSALSCSIQPLRFSRPAPHCPLP